MERNEENMEERLQALEADNQNLHAQVDHLRVTLQMMASDSDDGVAAARTQPVQVPAPEQQLALQSQQQVTSQQMLASSLPHMTPEVQFVYAGFAVLQEQHQAERERQSKRHQEERERESKRRQEEHASACKLFKDLFAGVVQQPTVPQPVAALPPPMPLSILDNTTGAQRRSGSGNHQPPPTRR